MSYDNQIKWLENLLAHYDTGPFRNTDCDDYEPLEDMIECITEPVLTPVERDHIDRVMTMCFGSGEWAGDTWRTYVRDWEGNNEVSDWDRRYFVEEGLEMTLQYFIEQKVSNEYE